MNKQRILLLVTLLIVLLLGCTGAALVLLGVDKTITITFVDAQTRQPVQPATLQADGATVTVENGKFRVAVPGPTLGLVPQLKLKAAAPGYISDELTLFVPWWQTHLATQINLSPTQVKGRVLDADTGEPLPAAIQVQSNGLAQTHSLNADNQGHFSISHLKPPVTVQVDAGGYKLRQIQLEADELLAGIVLLQVDLLPEHLIGTITDAQDGAPVPAVVYLTDSQATQRTVVADESGHFEAMYLEPPLLLRVEAPGFEVWQSELAALDMVVGNPAFKVAVNLSPRLTAGSLQAADTGERLTGLTITAGSGAQMQTVTSDANGRFQFFRLHPATPIVVAPPAGYLPAEIVFNNEAELTLALQPRQVTVTVRDSFARQPLPGAQLSFAQTKFTTNAQGQAMLTRIPAGGQILANLPGYHPAEVDYAGETTLEMVLTSSALQGFIRDRDTGQLLPQALIYQDDTILRADDTGYFMVNLPATEQPLMVKSAGYHRAYGQLNQTGVITTGPPLFSGVEGRWVSTAPCAAPVQPGPPCVELLLEPFHVKGIYVSQQYLYDRDKILQYLDFITATELNAIVIDVKGDYGFINWDSRVELAKTVGAERKPGKNSMTLDELVAEAKKRGVYTVGRFVVFKDHPLANGKPELGALRADGTVWIDGENLAWSNPFKEEVWDYNIALAQELAAFGFDEINFDYLRFPSDGNVGAIVYEEESTPETRTAAITEFVKRMREALDPYGLFVSADVFGLTIWVRPDSDMNIGQRVADIGPYLDYLAPMVYPSTFIPGNLGYDNPSAEPYGIVYRSQEQAEERVPPYVKVRPWLQGYWYSLEEMKELKQAAADANSTGWVWWNAGGKYDPDLFEPAETEE